MKAKISLLDLDEIIVLLKDRKLSVVARKTGIQYQILRSIAIGATKNPSYRHVDALREYFS